MNNLEKIGVLKTILQYEIYDDSIIDLLEKIEAVKHNYFDYLTSESIDCDKELKRLPDADYDLCCALITMLLREDHFSNGSFADRCQNGDVASILSRMIDLLYNTITAKPIKISIISETGYGPVDSALRQRLTFNSTGLMYLTNTTFGEDAEKKTQRKNIGEDKAIDIINKVEKIFKTYMPCVMICDAGTYELTITYDNDIKLKFCGSIAEDTEELSELSKYIRQNVGFDELMLFDGEIW